MEAAAAPAPTGNPFVDRMIANPRPLHESMTNPAYRIFYDPPEMISLAFGGRPWFHHTDCRAVFRIGLFGGLGWGLGEYVRKQLDGKTAAVNGVRITARAHNISRAEPLYDMYFVEFWRGDYDRRDDPDYEPDNLDPPQFRVIDHRPGLTAEQLKPAYAEALGEHAI